MSRILSRCSAATALVLALAAASLAQSPLEPGGRAYHRNVLVIVADDLGTDKVGCYGEHPQAPPTPYIDSLAQTGVKFRRAYSNPVCSPTRAMAMTGRYGFRTGIGRVVRPESGGAALRFGELTLAEALHQGTAGAFSSSAVGKWHLGSQAWGGIDHPLLSGFGDFRGVLGNFTGIETYHYYQKVRNGNSFNWNVYATIDQVDEALRRIGQMPEPWFLYLSFSAPHEPYHQPPSDLHSYNLSGDPRDTAQDHYDAAVEAMDTEIGRLLFDMGSVRQRTDVVFFGDNGTPGPAVRAPLDPFKSKGTLYEGGIRVPMIVSGPSVSAVGAECDALVSVVDVFSTVLDLAGVHPASVATPGLVLDSISMVPYLSDPGRAPLREAVMAEKFGPNGPAPYASEGRMIRDARWKLMTRGGTPDQLFDMAGTDVEGADLLSAPLTAEAQQALDRLRQELAALLAG